MRRQLLVGLDVGTTSAKAVAFTTSGRAVATGRVPTTWKRTVDGVETSGERLAATAHHALAALLAQVSGDRVIALGVASMAESGVLTDDADNPLAPVIAWHDARDIAQLKRLEADVGEDQLARHTGLPLWTQWSLTKFRWVREHLPSTERTRRRYGVAEWVVRSLGGRWVTERSLGSRTGWLELRTGAPWAPTLEWAGASAPMLGDVVGAGTPLGRARTGGALAGLDGAVLTVAGHDHQVAAVGLGAHRPGTELDSCGTAHAVLRTVAPGLTDQAVVELTRHGVTVGHHAAPERLCLLGATQGGLVLGEVLSALGVDRTRLAELDDSAAAARDRADVLALGPGPAEVAISAGATPGEVWRAATREACHQITDLEHALARATGPSDRTILTGGWTNSTAFVSAREAAAGRGVCVVSDEEAGCRGAAMFAGVAAGIYAGVDEAASPRQAIP